MRRTRRAAAVCGALLGALLPAAAAAQIGPSGMQLPRQDRWSPVVGVRASWNYRDQAPAAGAFLRLALPLRFGPAVAASGDVVFHDGLEDGQGFLDVTVDPARGLYLGGGAAVLNTIFEEDAERETRVGWSFVGGLRAGRAGPVDLGLEFRWIRVDDMRPNFIALTVGYPLLGRPGR